MPSASPSLQRARNLALQPQGWDVPSWDGRHALTELSASTDSINSHPYANTQQIYRKVCEWFVSWRPWQQKMLLCGITNKCTTVQLESLATTLEPIFHRDFVTSLRKSYPSTPFIKAANEANENKGKSGERSRKTTPATSRRNSISFTGLGSREISEVSLHKRSQGITRDSTMVMADIMEVPSPEKATPVLPPHPTSGLNDDPLAVYARGFAEQVIADALEQYKEYLEPGGSRGTSMSESALQPPKSAASMVLPPGLSHPVISLHSVSSKQRRNSVSSTTSSRKSRKVSSIDGPLGSRLGSKSSFKSKVSSVMTSLAVLNALNSREKVVKKQSAQGMPLVQHHLTLASRLQLLQAHPPSVSDDRLHRHRSTLTASSSLRDADFFTRSHTDLLGPVQAELRSGPVHRPAQVEALYIPMQRMYKPMKLWGTTPREGKNFVKPNRTALKKHFQQQLAQIWEWMVVWQEYEKLSLLVEILKLCDTTQISYFTQCLASRLQEKLDINWLSDRLLLLVFSYLPADGIEACSRVCRRWRYLASIDDLWRLKCQELGLAQGIPDILTLVASASSEDQSIDWKLAFLELQRISDEAKDSLPIPQTLSFEAPTPEGMRRVGGGKFVPIQPEGFASVARGRPGRPQPGGAPDLEAIQSISESEGLSAAPAEYIPYWERDEQQGSQAGSLPASARGSEPSSNKSGKAAIGGKVKVTPQGSQEGMGASREDEKKEATAMDAVDAVAAEQHKSSMQSVATSTQARGRKKKGDDEGEVALDVRPELTQAPDLLREPLPSHRAQDPAAMSQQLEKYTGDVANIRRVRKLQGHMDSVLCIEFDSRRLISGSMDRTIRIWDIRSGRSIHKLYGHKGGVCCLQFDNEELYSGSWDMSIQVWHLVHFNRKAVLSGHRGSISGLKMDGDQLLSSSHDGTVRIWCRRGYVVLRTLQIHRSPILSMCFDGTHILTGSHDRTMKLTLLASGECVKTFLGHTEPVERMLMSGNLILTANKKGVVYFWSRRHGSMEAAIQAHDASVTSLAFHNGHFFTASSDASIREWDLSTMATVRLLQGHKGPVNDFKVSSRCFVSCSTDGHIRIWDTVIPMLSLGLADDDNIRIEFVDQRNKQNPPSK